MYTHPTIAPWLRENFGFHAAYLMGNYLFGTQKPGVCALKDPMVTIEGHKFPRDRDMMKPSEFREHLPRCGVDPASSLLITNDGAADGYTAVHTMADDLPETNVCSLRKLTSGTRIIQTFGSRLGFWATALQGKAGGFVNAIDRICVNLTNSQQGSLWHTFCPREKEGYIFRTNSRLFACKSDVDDIKLYIDYLLW
jgi:hypothetical protein